LETAKWPKGEVTDAVNRAAGILEISELLDRLPAQLSGGQRQRVALARAIVREPVVFLMDEPLSNLDAQLRLQTRIELMALHERLGITTIYVTHDQVEAMTMGHRIAVMQSGVLQQVGEPTAVYDTPRTTFVATFMGAPPMNLIAGEVARSDTGYSFVREGYKLDIDPQVMAIDPAVLEESVGTATLGIRPEHLALAAPDGEGVPGLIHFLEPVGSDLFVSVDIGGKPVQVRMPPHTKVKTGENTRVAFDPSLAHIFDSDKQNLRMKAG
jgi:ABC-type sugar transport system ATPase subunit